MAIMIYANKILPKIAITITKTINNRINFNCKKITNYITLIDSMYKHNTVYCIPGIFRGMYISRLSMEPGFSWLKFHG